MVSIVGKNGNITCVFLGFTYWAEVNTPTAPVPSNVPHTREKSPRIYGRKQYGCITRACAESPWWGEINTATSPVPSRGPHTGEKSMWVHHVGILGVPMVVVGTNQYGYITPAFPGSP